MAQENNAELKTIKMLYDQSKALNAVEAHFMANQIFGDEQASAVYSVFIGVKPDHLIISELMDWAQANGNQELLDKIESLSNDLSFLQED